MHWRVKIHVLEVMCIARILASLFSKLITNTVVDREETTHSNYGVEGLHSAIYRII